MIAIRIGAKYETYRSKAYDVDMNFAMFFTNDGKAIHQYHGTAGLTAVRFMRHNVSDWFGSHGCVRLVFTDNAYVNRAVVRELPANIDLVGRGRMDAALHEQAIKRRGRGRPRIRGRRLPTPAQQASRKRWSKLSVNIYGKQAKVRIQTFDALWYKVGRERVMRFVVIRDWPGHAKDDVLVTTDLSLGAAAVIEGYLHTLVARGDLRLGQESSRF